MSLPNFLAWPLVLVSIVIIFVLIMYHLRLRSYPLDRKTATTNHPTDQSACDTQLYERPSLLGWPVAATSLHIIIAFGAIVRRISSPA